MFLALPSLVQAEEARALEERLLAEPRDSLAAAARREGDATRGAATFYGRVMACSTCHSVGDRPDAIGPDLARMDKRTADAALVEAILEPSKTIAAGYATVSIETADGQILSGLPVEETAEHLVLRDAAEPEKLITLKKQEIADRQPTTQSAMPSGQVNQLADRGQFLDLVRYLIELRDGGIERARQLQPPPDLTALKVPDDPLPWQPVVQRGEVAVDGQARYPRGVALGFAGGTVLFDADQLGTPAMWSEGFVRSSPQNYFGLYWHRQGSAAEKFSLDPHPLRFKLPGQESWQAFEPPPKSDPNVGSRFEGYQIGRTAVRLRYRVLVGQTRVSVIEDVRGEGRPGWQGFARRFQFYGLPAGGQAALSLPAGEQFQPYSGRGEKVSDTAQVGQAPLIAFRSGGTHWAARQDVPAGGAWQADDHQGKAGWRLVSTPAKDREPVVLRLDLWKYCGRSAAPSREELALLETNPPVIEDAFDGPRKPLTPAPLAEAAESESQITQRPAVSPRENIDEFPPAKGRFLRFVIARTNDNTAPGLDELEVYGADPKVNLALTGKASASSVISGYPIHQIHHLNDGQLGNFKSWISAEAGRGWAQIEFPQPVEMCRIVWARDRTGECKDRLAVAYRIEVSDDGQKWRKVGDERGRTSHPGTAVTIRRDASPGYVMEAIPAPFPGCRPSDIAFADDGTMYVIAMTEGQIWRTRIPPAGQPQRVRWQRFATGLFHPIGLAIVNGRIYVAQKPEITELIDRDGDGVADHYRTVATGWGLSTGWHEYTFGLAVDPQKNLWFALNTGTFNPANDFVRPGRWRGSIIRVSQGAERLEEMATGCRVPNGITQGANGDLFFTDNQGDYIPVCKVAPIVPGRFYGHMEDRSVELPPGKYPSGLAAVWLPYHIIRSASGPVHDATQGKFGPFADQLFVGDAGYGANGNVMRVALEKVDGEYQGACFRFINGQPLGCERMRFGPDQSLYMASLTSGLTRMKFDGTTPLAIRSLNIRPRGQGFVVNLTRPLAADTQLSPSGIRVKRYHYMYWRTYGSPPKDQKDVPVEKAELSPDRTAITLTFPVETHPLGMVYEINVGKLVGMDGEALLHNDAWYTVQKIP